MKNLTETGVQDDETVRLWNAICEQTSQFMNVGEFTQFVFTGWEETDGVSLFEAASANDHATMQKILDCVTFERKDYEAAHAAKDEAPLDTPEKVDGPVSFDLASQI